MRFIRLATPAAYRGIATKSRQLLAEHLQSHLSLATMHGIHPDVVGAEFSTEVDRLDVIERPEHDDDTLKAYMATLCTM